MRPSRIVLVLIAVMAGGLAAYLATQGDEPVAVVAEPVTEIVQEPRTQILVARQAIGVGQRLSPATIGWEDWPEGAVRAEYITIATSPEAMTDMSGSVARFEIFPGEPIRTQKLAQPDAGYLSAVLDPGMRAVSVSVTADSASGGFIVPNDRVDVIMTRQSETSQVSETILQNVRVLAINARLGETGTTGAPPAGKEDDPQADIFDRAIATLALDPAQAEIIINAAMLGKLSLVLRSMVDFAEAGNSGQSANQAIRISSPFWSN